MRFRHNVLCIYERMLTKEVFLVEPLEYMLTKDVFAAGPLDKTQRCS